MQDVRVERFVGVFGEGVVMTRPAPPSLRRHVYGYTGYEERTAFARRREAPTGAVVVIIDLGEGLTVLDPASPDRAGVRLGGFVAGPTDRAVVVDSGGQQTGIQLNLTPVGARLFLHRPLREVTNQTVPLEDLVGAHGRRLVERLRAAGSWQARFALLDQELGTRMAAAASLPPELLWAWHALSQGSGRVSVGALAHELGCSRKHLTVQFATELGLAPKTTASILRFRQAIVGLERGVPASLAELATACGYSDQAHLNRDFRRFAGITPTEHRRLYTPEFGLRAE